MTGSASDVLESTVAEASAAPPEFRPERTEAFDACVEDIRRRLGSDIPLLVTRLEDLIRRRLGVAPLSAGAALLLGSLGVVLRLALVLLVTALAGQWAGIPWGRWAVILVFYGLLEASRPSVQPPLDVRPPPYAVRQVDDWTALLPTMVRESDVRELADFTRRWVRLPVAAVVGVVVAMLIFGACWLFAPTGLSELHPGSIVLLALLLYDFGATVVNPIDWAVMTRAARYEHRLFLSSPVDSPEVQRAVRVAKLFGFATGMWITILLVLAVVLVSWDSPLVLPLAVGFVVFGYLTAIGSTLGFRAGIEKIVRRARDQHLAVLRRRIDAFEPRFGELFPEESEQLRGLIDLHNVIRDAPTTPTATHTLLHAAVGLIIPTIMFVVAVFGEVYAERILDAILP